MENAMRITKVESQLISLMNKMPILSYYANSRGWTFLISWGHRLAGLTLVGYMLAHIFTLSLLFTPATYDADMKFLHNFIFTFLEWAVAVPVIFHSLNGGRLMLYELFHVRAEELMIRSMAVLGLIYILLLGMFFIQGGPQLSATAFWSITIVISLIVCFIVFKKIWVTGNSMLWKLQRVTGAFMLPMIIGHMLFMHMNYLTGHDSKTVLLRMQNPFTKGMDFVFIIILLFHAGYGVFSVVADYLKPGPVLKALTALIIIAMVIAAIFGIRLAVAL
jgi:succinate dehydrogenase hydrophobic membrane anchor protein